MLKFFVSISIFISLSFGAFAQNIKSEYSKLDLNECLLLDADDMGASFACAGYRGFPIYVAEGDLRMFVSYGFGAPNEKAAEQTLPQFNTINETLEWRLLQVNDNWIPFATILRWFLEDGDPATPDGQVLVVTKIEANNTCHIAYVDAQLVANANEIARNFADNESADFNCETDEIYYVPS